MLKKIDGCLLTLADLGVESAVVTTGLSEIVVTRILAAITVIVQAIALYPHPWALAFATAGLIALHYYTETTTRNVNNGVLDYGIRLAFLALTVLFAPVYPVMTTISAFLVLIYFYVLDCDSVVYRPR